MPLEWSDTITDNPALNAIEIWVLHNFTHPIHIHEVQFQVVDRSRSVASREGPSPGNAASKARSSPTLARSPVKAQFDLPGLYVWHCHIVEHEDNEMMRPT